MPVTACASTLKSDDTVVAMKASDRIRNRVVQAGRTFRANDSIADFIIEGDLGELQKEVEEKVTEVLRTLVIDIDNDHNTMGTAKRVAKMFLQEVFAGRYNERPPVTTFPNVSRLNELMVIGPIKVRSACSHHLCPIMGKVWIGVLPEAASELIGLSKFSRICDWVMSRPQIQEEAVTMLADELEAQINPEGLAVIMQAEHFCMHWRGVKEDESVMTSSVMRGAFRDVPDLRRDFIELCHLRHV